MALLTYPKFQVPNLSGLNLSGGKVYFYEVGTSTPKDTYSDAALTVPNANPVILDSRGEADIYVDGAYKIILKDAKDVDIWTIDDFRYSTTVVTETPIIVATKTIAAALVLTSDDAGRVIHITSDDGGKFVVKYNATPGTYADNGGSYCGTQFIPTGGDGTIGLVRDYSGAVNVKWFGAKGDGVTDDTAACQTAITYAANKKLEWVKGTYLVDNLTGVSGTQWVGDGMGITEIKARSALTDDFIKFVSKTDFSIRNITINYNNVGTTGTLGAITLLFCDDWKIDSCEIKSFVKVGLAINGATNFRITNNVISKDATATALNQAILTTNVAAVAVDNGIIQNNKITNSGTILQGRNINVSFNDISGWGYGAGISTPQDVANSDGYVIHGNIIHDSNNALDGDGFTTKGIENWASHSVITGNTIYKCSGTGVYAGGKDASIVGNVIFDNGVYASNEPGITLGHYDATYTSSGSTITGNKCFDKLGAGGTQSYGIEAHASATGLVISGNECSTNKTADYNLPGSYTSFFGDNILHTFVYDAPSIAAQTTLGYGQVVTGAALGDLVQASCSIYLAGLTLSAEVYATNNIQIILTNNTAAAIDLASATFRVLITKPHK